LTDIKLAPGIRVYARDSEERQFLFTGFEDFELLSIDFRTSSVEHCGFWSGEHNVKLTPSQRYIVCLAENPRSYLWGTVIDHEFKGEGWVVDFDGDTARWRRK